MGRAFRGASHQLRGFSHTIRRAGGMGVTDLMRSAQTLTQRAATGVLRAANAHVFSTAVNQASHLAMEAAPIVAAAGVAGGPETAAVTTPIAAGLAAGGKFAQSQVKNVRRLENLAPERRKRRKAG
ncbi:MAG: hypothetical protein AAFO91_00205 [Bacteroidota bacterium]